MLKLLAFLWSGCWHKWEVRQIVGLDYHTSAGTAKGVRVLTECSRCGAHRKWDLV